MNPAPPKFADLLTKAIHRIKTESSQKVKDVQDELGFALGRQTGGSVIEYWRKGNLPSSCEELERLALLLVHRKALRTPEEVYDLLLYAGHPYPEALRDRLCPPAGDEPFLIPEPAADWQHLGAFVAGPPILHPRQFYGREAEISRAFAIFSRFPLQHLAVLGPRRSGKTSLLHYLKTVTTALPSQVRPGQRRDWLPRPERYRWIFVDFQDPTMRRQDRLLAHLLAGFGQPGSPPSLNAFVEAVRYQVNSPVIILLDEIGSALSSPHLDHDELWDCLRSLASNSTGGNLAFVVASRIPLPDLFGPRSMAASPFFNIFGHVIDMKPFSEAEALHLMAASPRPFSAADQAWIFKESGGWPFLVQMLSAELLSMEESRSPEGSSQAPGGPDQPQAAEVPVRPYSAPAVDGWKERARELLAPYRYLLEQA